MFKLKNFRSSGGHYYADSDKGNGENIPVEIQKGVEQETILPLILQ